MTVIAPSPARLVRCLVLVCLSTALGNATAADSGSSLPLIYRARTTTSYHVAVTLPSDQRSQHFGEPQRAGNDWKGCQPDSLAPHNPPGDLQNHITRALREARLFDGVTMAAPQPTDLVLSADLEALCGQNSGFILGHVTGAAMAHVTVRKGDQVLFDQHFEKVVFDSDPEFSGQGKDFSGDPAQAAMNDALRALSIDVVKQLENAVERW